MRVKPNHPLAEQIASHLHGIESVPHREAGRMVNRAAMEAVKWHDAELDAIDAHVRHWLGERPELAGAYVLTSDPDFDTMTVRECVLEAVMFARMRLDEWADSLEREVQP